MSLPAFPAHFTFDAPSERLTGMIGTDHFHLHAVSGGGRGRTVGVASDTVESHLATTQLIKHGPRAHRGGTLPPGTYRCQYLANHHHFHECVRLHALPSATAIHSPFATMPIVHGRGGFYIHGRGRHGSDGCIVPLLHGERVRLNHAIRDYAGPVLLRVTNVPYTLPAENVRGVVS